MNPKYYDTMSSLLDALIEQRRQEAIDYADYLHQLLELAAKVGKEESDTVYPEWAKTRRPDARSSTSAGRTPTSIVEVDPRCIQSAKEHGWVGNRMKERALARALRRVLPDGLRRRASTNSSTS